MIQPIVHRSLRREDLTRLVDAIRWGSAAAARSAAQALEAGVVHDVLDAPERTGGWEEVWLHCSECREFLPERGCCRESL